MVAKHVAACEGWRVEVGAEVEGASSASAWEVWMGARLALCAEERFAVSGGRVKHPAFVEVQRCGEDAFVLIEKSEWVC